MNHIDTYTQDQVRTDIPSFHAGDTLNVYLRIIEGDKERIQLFSGVVLQMKGSGVSKTFTIRKISNGIGVERIIPLNSPKIDRIEKLKEGKVRQAKILYLRERKGKSARIKEVKRYNKAAK